VNKRPSTSPQIATEPAEADTVADDTGDVDTTAQGDQDADNLDDVTGADYEAAAADSDNDSDDDEMQTLRRENARRRVRTQETEAENERLTGMLTQYHRDTVERAAAATLVAPADLWRVADLAELMTDDGNSVDEAKVHAMIAERVPSHWAKPKPSLDFGGFRSGSGRRPEVPAPTSWASAISPASE
jgi:hypothetical protein